MKRSQFLYGAAASATSCADFAGIGSARSAIRDDGFAVSSDAMHAAWSIIDRKLVWSGLRDRLAGRSIPLPRDVFAIVMSNGTAVRACDFRVVSGPAHRALRVDPHAACFAQRFPGVEIAVELLNPEVHLRARWSAVLRDGSPYIRQTVELRPLAPRVHIARIVMLDFAFLPDAFVLGSVDGSPIVSGNVFAALEHPLAQSEAIYDRASATLPVRVPLRAGVPLAASSVIGVSAPGQLRRTFLQYVERERAHPYRPFLHYNSWYDLGYFTPYTAAQAVQRIRTFGEELCVRRGARLSSFLFDDGWDDPAHLWRFNAGFPDGFAPLHEAAARFGAAPGAWLSPWGGYGKPREERLASAKREGYGVNEDGLALSEPKYYAYFESIVERFIKRGGVNQFKLDGTGNAASVYPGSRFGSDFEAAIHLIETARALEPNLCVNLTTGTYPSPFWLRWCDSIWRGGYDHDFYGPGSHRQKWMTYRDADTYAGIVTQGPLYPLNSVMLHGLIYAAHAKHLRDDPHGDFRDEVRSYFATGTQLQEMYVSQGCKIHERYRGASPYRGSIPAHAYRRCWQGYP